jgi:hypothetical protein
MIDATQISDMADKITHYISTQLSNHQRKVNILT